MSHIVSGFNGFIYPITHDRSINEVMNCGDYHLSYNPCSADYGSDTTAIVFSNHLFFTLNGDHRKALSEITSPQGCLDYFIEHINEANDKSEHLIVCGKKKDAFKLVRSAVEMIGQENIDRICRAVDSPC